MEAFTIKRSDIERCPRKSLSPRHYNPDGTCTCMVIYECGICGAYHPWDWDGDCREDVNRFGDPEEFAEKRGIAIDKVEVRSMDDRVEADSK